MENEETTACQKTRDGFLSDAQEAKGRKNIFTE